MGEIKENDDDDQGKLPVLKKGDIVVLAPPKVKAEQKFTQPPPRYKNHSLVKELESRGIGRPSTYAAIIAKVTDRHYVEKKSDTFYATDLGKKVVDLLIKFFDFMQYQYTADMEDKLDKIAEGKLDYLGMMNSFFPSFKDQLKKAKSASNKDFGINCWACGKSMQLKHGKFGHYMVCLDYPECKTSCSCEIIDNKPVVKEKAVIIDGVVCPKCAACMTVCNGKFGKFYSCTKYPRCNGTAKIPSGQKCNKCGFDMYETAFDGIAKLACMGYPSCRNIQELPDMSIKNNKGEQKIPNLSRKT